ncbi:MAG TPA: protein-disulfide reductase DsbD [Steroidobacteraceae bacterium]|jgi:thiol:disulfide interchange protein DsbD|nr:protein-disulfide reductase DsbD [Steroidobacteraceae bacterium]
MKMIGRLVLVLLAQLLLIAAAGAKDDFLSPDKAYRYTTRVEGDRLIVSWDIEKGYYLYKKKMGVVSGTADAQLGEPLWPKGEDHTDEYFGTQEIYRGKVEVPVPIVISGSRPPLLNIELRLQGCADAGLCYPPQKWKTEVKLPATSSAAPQSKSGGGLSALLGKKSAAAGNQGDFLPPDEAFRFGAGLAQADSVPLTWVIADGYYLYKDRISIESATPNVQIGKPVLPKGKPKHDEYFGDAEVYYEVLEATLPVARAASNQAQPLHLKVTYQGCAEGGLCYNPITKEASIELPPTSTATNLPASVATVTSSASGEVKVAEQDRLATALQGGNLAYALLLFFGAGLLLSLTPCVLPMIPILSGIIVGQGANVTRARSFALALTYSQGMALTYAAAGAIFVLAFRQTPQAFFQSVPVITFMVLLFIALALAMFGVYTLQMPSALQTRLSDVSNQQKAGTFVGTFIMGALSALVVTACVAPAIIAALSVISQSRQVLRGAAALYATGVGMGVPLLIVGASAGQLLPKVGPWMDTVKQMFGVLFLGVGIYIAQPLLPDAVSMMLWSALAVISGFWVFSLKARDGAPVASPVRAVGLLVLLYGVVLLIGAASGGHDPLQPLGNLSVSSGAAGKSANGGAAAVAFRRIKSVADLEREVAAASAAGKPVMLDFYADWCASCKEMEKYTFPDPQVQAVLADAVLLQADVTKNDDEDRALLNRFEIFGPPTIAFFGRDGVERKNFRLVGFAPAPRFAEHVKSAFAS